MVTYVCRAQGSVWKLKGRERWRWSLKAGSTRDGTVRRFISSRTFPSRDEAQADLNARRPALIASSRQPRPAVPMSEGELLTMVRLLAAEGLCSPSCLFGIGEGWACVCRCRGRYHGFGLQACGPEPELLQGVGQEHEVLQQETLL